MKLRLEYWEKFNDIEPKNLVVLDEAGVARFNQNSCTFPTRH